MALTQVRAKLLGERLTLTYNADTGQYETDLPSNLGLSVDQPGGYYSLEAEAQNESGLTASMSGDTVETLRLVVYENVKPTLTLVSPPPGFLGANTPSVLVDAADEDGGSGVDGGSFAVAVDGAEQGSGLSVEETSGGFRCTFTPVSPLADGPHTLTFTVSDRDGNTASLGAAYTVDTVPPSLALTAPDSHRVVDWTSIVFGGQAGAGISDLAAFTVGGVDVPVEDGRFEYAAPLSVGVNLIEVKAVSGAGLVTSETLWVLRLITDRAQADVDYMTALYKKAWDDFTPAEKEYYRRAVNYGEYNDSDRNRVGVAVEYLSEWLTEAGYLARTHPKTDWTEPDIPTAEAMETYRQNIVILRSLLPVQAPEAPPDMIALTHTEANGIEAILVGLDRFRPQMEKSPFYAGEIMAGEY